MAYFIRNKHTTNVKIGHSDVSSHNRMRTFQTGQDCELEFIGEIPGEKKDEAALHRKFAHLRVPNVGKEWFRADAELLAAIGRLLNPYPRLLDREIQSVYLAGKIIGDRWREAILPPFDGHNHWSVSRESEEWFVSRLVEAPGFSGRLDYYGPFWLNSCAEHGINDFSDHAYGVGWGPLETNRDLVRSKSLNGIMRADLVFAWIDDVDCFGTLAEITAAYAHSRLSCRPKVIVVAIPGYFDADAMWFVVGMGQYVITDAKSPRDAWNRLWRGDVSPVARRPPAVPDGPDTSLFRVGARVMHPNYGVGTIVWVFGEGERKKVRVDFANASDATFIVVRSPLRVVLEDNQ